MTVIDTRTVTNRRALRLETLDDLRAEVERLHRAASAGEVRPLGNWSVAQVFQHVGRLMELSFNGFPFRYPWHLRLAARLVRLVSWRWPLLWPSGQGFGNPPVASALEPDAGVALDAAAAYLRGQIERLGRGERMEQPSPAEGPIGHERWLFAHLRHAELHFSFLATGPATLSQSNGAR